MDIVFLACWATLPLIGSLLLAARLWGKERVIRAVGDWAFNTRWILDGFACRLLRACRALVAVDLDAADLRDDLVDEVEEMVSRKMQERLTLLNSKIHALEHQVSLLIAVREENISSPGDRY